MNSAGANDPATLLAFAMIRNYSDHAANERTFLAWVRTGIAVIAFGFVIEKLNLFITEIATAASAEGGRALTLPRLGGPLGRYDGLALILVGIGLIVVAGLRFVRTTRLIDDPETHSGASLRAEVLITAILALLAGAVSIYLVLD
jgi:putative membrane protein